MVFLSEVLAGGGIDIRSLPVGELPELGAPLVRAALEVLISSAPRKEFRLPVFTPQMGQTKRGVPTGRGGLRSLPRLSVAAKQCHQYGREIDKPEVSAMSGGDEDDEDLVVHGDPDLFETIKNEEDGTVTIVESDADKWTIRTRWITISEEFVFDVTEVV